MSDIDQKPPIPREDAPTPDPVLTALQAIANKLDAQGYKLDTHQSILEGVSTKVIDLSQRVTKLEEKAPGSNPPPRTASGFTAAVDARAKAISLTTESEPDKATAAQVAELRAALVTLTSKTDAQTHMLEVLVDGLGSFARNPTVRKIAYIAGGLLLGWLSHLAQKGLFQ